MKRLLVSILFLVCASWAFGQVPTSGNLIRVHNVNTTQMLGITGVERGALIYNTDSLALYEYNGLKWIRTANDKDSSKTNELLDSAKVRADSTFFYYPQKIVKTKNEPRVYMGTFTITSTGNLSISGLPFKPSLIQFTAYANIDSDTLNADNGVGNNNTGINNSFGYMTGFAQIYNSLITQQVICGGGNGNSINDISRFASSKLCIGVRYGNQNGDNLGVTSAKIISFNNNGFTINVNSKADNLQVIYTAFR